MNAKNAEHYMANGLVDMENKTPVKMEIDDTISDKSDEEEKDPSSKLKNEP